MNNSQLNIAVKEKSKDNLGVEIFADPFGFKTLSPFLATFFENIE
jgi:hypothetical protein